MSLKNEPTLDGDALSRIELGPQLRKLLVRLGVRREERALVALELLRERLEARVVEDGLVRRELEQLRIGLGELLY